MHRDAYAAVMASLEGMGLAIPDAGIPGHPRKVNSYAWRLI